MFEDPLQGPSPEALEDRVPVAERRRQVAPGRTNPNHPQYTLQEHAIVCPRSAGITDLARQKRSHTFPLFITHNQTIHGFLHFGSHESAMPCPELAAPHE